VSDLNIRDHAAALIALVIGLAYAHLALLFGLQHRLSPVQSVIALALLTGPLALAAYFALTRLVSPRLSVFPPAGRYALLAVSGGLGLALLLSTPFGLPTGQLIQRISTAPLAVAINQVVSLITLLLAGGFLMVTLLLVVVGVQRPLSPRFPVVTLFIAAYLLAGLAVYDDYGVSVDEPLQRTHGYVAMKYVTSRISPHLAEQFRNTPDLETYDHRYYGVAFHLPLVAFEVVNQLRTEDDMTWLFRHYATFLLSFGGVLAFYRLAADKFESWLLGLAGALFLVLTPRIFAESFYNIKDGVFLAAFSIALYFGFRYWRRKDIMSALLFGAATALAANVRVVAILFMLLVPAIIIFDYLTIRGDQRRNWPGIAAALATLLSLYLLTAPAAWADPPGYLVNTLGTFSDYAYDAPVIYMDDFMWARSPPWHYLPVWMAITIPVSYLLLFAVGIIAIMRAVIRHHIGILWQPEREDMLFLLLFAAPIVAAITLNSTLYNGWRHIHFVYVPFLLVALRGLQALVARFRSLDRTATRRRLAFLILFAGLSIYQLDLLRWMAVNHPFQNVHFTPVVKLFGGRSAFERDYWALSARQALEYILANDDREAIAVWSGIGEWEIAPNLHIMPADAQARIALRDHQDSPGDYVIETYRLGPGDYPFAEEWFSIAVDGLPIMTVYAVDDAAEAQPLPP
jgi:ABC-type multidrug transport system fused ATPase/permease subunit